jgi:hypothetical protein
MSESHHQVKHECKACPFSESEESENAYHWGCLPGPNEVVQLRQKEGKTWACHANERKPCLGALLHMKGKGLPYKIIDSTLALPSKY